MKKSKVVMLVAAALVAGLTLGSFGIASAAPETDPATNEPLGFHLRVGWALRQAGARVVDIVSDLTGLSVEDIHDRRVDGESLADIAESEGVDPAKIVDESLAAREALLDEKVAEGVITEEQKAEILARMSERMTERIESDQPGPFGRGGGRGGRGGGCFGGAGAAGAGSAGGGCGNCQFGTGAPASGAATY